MFNSRTGRDSIKSLLAQLLLCEALRSTIRRSPRSRGQACPCGSRGWAVARASSPWFTARMAVPLTTILSLTVAGTATQGKSFLAPAGSLKIANCQLKIENQTGRGTPAGRRGLISPRKRGFINISNPFDRLRVVSEVEPQATKCPSLDWLGISVRE